METKGSMCSLCGAFVSDLDAGFCLAVHSMQCECGGQYLHLTVDDGCEHPGVAYARETRRQQEGRPV